MKKCFLGIFLLAATLLQQAFAVTLWEAYYQALGSDPTFKAAQQLYLATKENIPIERAALLPNLSLTGATQRQYNYDRYTPFFTRTLPSRFYNTNNNYTLNLSQPIFNYAAWYSLREADYQVREAEANFVGAVQDLMLRVSQAYFGVLQANDTLRYTQEQRKAVGEQLRQTEQQYEVGLVPITGVKEAQANYDSLISQEIAARTNLADAMELLRTITGRSYSDLMGTNNKLPLIAPEPPQIDLWVKTTECQNYALLAAIYAANVARENIKIQEGGHFPVISAIGSYEYNKDSSGIVNAGILDSQVLSGGVQVNLPIYAGGGVNAQVAQAIYQYQQAISNLEFAHRAAIQQTRDGFLGVISGINAIKADRQAVVSSYASLDATRQGYQVGTRTILDVLNVEASLYKAQQTYSIDQYNYLTSILTLKEAAGTINPGDIAQISAWLNTDYNIASKLAGVANVAQAGAIAGLTSSAPKEKASKSISKPKAAVKKPMVKSVKSKTPQKSKATLSAGTYYVISLFDTRYKQHALDFISAHSLHSKATYLTAKNSKGEVRYQVVYGHYTSLKAAEAAMKKLPSNLRVLNPWVKEIK